MSTPTAHGAQTTIALRLSLSPTNEVQHSSLTDAELVRMAAGHGRGDPAALAELYERHVRGVFIFALSRLRNTTLAEDVTAQTFLHVVRALPQYEPRGVPIRSWFMTIAANVIRDTYRKAPPSSTGEMASTRSGGESSGSDAIAELRDASAEAAIRACEDDEVLTQLLSRLPPAQRSVIEHRFIAELSIAETARRMARSNGAIKMLQIRALHTLRHALGARSHRCRETMDRDVYL